MLKKIGAASLAVLAGATATAFQVAPGVAAASDATDAAAVCATEQATSPSAALARVSLSKVSGTLAFNQDEISSLSDITRALGAAAKYLCGSQGIEGAVAADAATTTPTVENILVKGDVENVYTVDLTDKKERTITLVMGCSCAGNPAGGLATANAQVTGVSLSDLMEEAGVSAAANTVVFTSADGYEVAMPLSYVRQRHTLIVTEVNGEPISDSVGSSNQLWLGATAARYFAKDITAVAFEERQTPPPAPYTDEGDEYYGNFPGVGVTGTVA